MKYTFYGKFQVDLLEHRSGNTGSLLVGSITDHIHFCLSVTSIRKKKTQNSIIIITKISDLWYYTCYYKHSDLPQEEHAENSFYFDASNTESNE